MGVMYNVNPATSGNPGFGVSSIAFSVNYLKALYDRPGAWRYIRNFTTDCSSFGESVAIPSFPRLTAVDVTVSTGAISYNSDSITQQSVVINKMKAVAYSVPEYMFLQSKVDIKTAFADEAARAVSDCLDHEFAKLIPSLSTNSVGTLNTDLTEAILWSAVGKLVTNHVDVTNPSDMVWILPSTQFGIVHALSKGYASQYKINAGSTNSNGMNDLQPSMETLFGIPLFFRADTELLVSGDAAYGGLFFRDAVGIAIQRMPALRAPQPIPGSVNMELLVHSLFGVTTLKQEVACLLKAQ